MTANRVYAMSAITALTAQNTTGVTDIMEVSPKFLAEQLDGIFTDIYPDAVKTGMVASGELIQVIADKLTEYKAGNIVVDPNIELDLLGLFKVWRNLRPDEVVSDGLSAKLPGRNMSIAGHLMNGSRHNGAQFISTRFPAFSIILHIVCRFPYLPMYLD